MAGAALLPGSGQAGVLLLGMPGSGKTACAVELARRYRASFGTVVFWRARPAEPERRQALASLAETVHTQLERSGFAVPDQIDTAESPDALALRVQHLVADFGVLLVLDDLQTLLTPGGAWREPHWASLISELTDHRGESRIILTSRNAPAGLSHRILAVPVHALNPADSVALAWQLPGLRKLLHPDGGAVDARENAAVEADRDLVCHALDVVGGHPKLLELAAAALDRADRPGAKPIPARNTAAGQDLEAFFRDDVNCPYAAEFVSTLAAWAASALAASAPPARLMAKFLACVEVADRVSAIVEPNWADLWRRLELPGDPPAAGPVLEQLAGAALIQAEAAPLGVLDGEGPVCYWMHPSVVQAVRASTSAAVRAAADTELASYWGQFSSWARQRGDAQSGREVTRACLAAAPYLLRLKDWPAARALIEHALVQNEPSDAIETARPALHAIAAAPDAPVDLAVLARTLATADTADPASAEVLLREALARTIDDGDYGSACGIADALLNLLRHAGRLHEALGIADMVTSYTQRAGFGVLTQLLHRGRKLQLLGLMGEHEHVLEQLSALLGEFTRVTACREEDETVEPWQVRETALQTGIASALQLNRWQQALDLSAAVLVSQQARQASADAITRTRLAHYMPLICLGRLAEAEQLLNDCQLAFEDRGDLPGLSQVLCARATVEVIRGDTAAAMRLAQDAIRIGYARPEPPDIAACHDHLASYLRAAEADPATQRAHRLAAAVLYQLAGLTQDLVDTCRTLAGELSQEGNGKLPESLRDVICVAEQTRGVRLGQMITTLQPDADAAADALAQILHDATNLA